MVNRSAPRYTGESDTKARTSARSNSVGTRIASPTSPSDSMATVCSRPSTDTAAGATNRISSRTNHSLPGTPVRAGGSPLNTELQAAIVVDGRMLSASGTA